MARCRSRRGCSPGRPAYFRRRDGGLVGAVDDVVTCFSAPVAISQAKTLLTPCAIRVTWPTAPTWRWRTIAARRRPLLLPRRAAGSCQLGSHGREQCLRLGDRHRRAEAGDQRSSTAPTNPHLARRKDAGLLGYTHDGFDIFAMPVREADWTPAEPYVDQRRPMNPEPPHREFKITDYDPLETLRPRRFGVSNRAGQLRSGDRRVLWTAPTWRATTPSRPP